MRTLTQNGEPWFVAADVCRALEVGNPSDALARLDQDERTLVSIEGASNGLPVNAINEPGLYALVLGSRKPEAKTFRRWITHEVIPAIRKTGSYTATSAKPASELQARRLEIMDRNSRTRQGQELTKLATVAGIPDTYKLVLVVKAAQVMTGEQLLALPESARRTYSATELGARFGVSANRIGHLANDNGLKTSEYGELVWDKSASSAKQVQAWRYYDTVIPILGRILNVDVA